MAQLSAARRPDLRPIWPGFCTFPDSLADATEGPRFTIWLLAQGAECAFGFR